MRPSRPAATVVASLLVASVLVTGRAHAQHPAAAGAHASPAAHAPHATPTLAGTHRLTGALGHTHISQGRRDGETQWLAVPSWSLNYDRWLTDRWAVGVQTDLVIESFVIEHGDEELLERTYPLAIVPVALWKPAPRWSLIGGVGAEVAAGRTLALTRLGAEYGVHVGDRYEVGAALVWDNKWNYYNSWGLAVTVSRLWHRR